MRRLLAVAPLALACCSPGPATKVVATPAEKRPPPRPDVPLALDALTAGQEVHGYKTVALYLDDADHPMGARFVHDKTGFVLDYLRIESAPQGFIWVNSFPTSDKGEPHTQEHLLLGKGDRGRKLGSLEAMALAESSAFTEQWRTCYHFHTVAGHDVFWPVFENQLDALLYPDYTDEEIRREVRNFGVDKGNDGALHLEEKGTVYNEMVRTYESSDAAVFRVIGQLVYGTAHPLSYESGGYPDAIRTMTPQDIRTFHDRAYQLSNMGMVGAYPSSMALADVLDHTATILDQEGAKGGSPRALGMTEATLPKPAPAAAGTVSIAEFPFGDTSSSGPIVLAWPASRELDEADRLLLELFVDAFAGDESTTLYKKLIDGKTRALDTGANGVFGIVGGDEGHPVFIGLGGVKATKLDTATVEQVRALVVTELKRIAALPDGDAELVAFDARVASRIVDRRRRLTKFLDTPPGFGFRGIGSEWMTFLHRLEHEPFRRSLTMRPALALVEQVLAGKQNPWRDRLAKWGLLDAPFGAAAKPSPQLRADLDSARAKRIADELDRLKKQFGDKDTLAVYQRAYDVESAKIEAAAKTTVLPPLVASLPMTFDDGLQYRTTEAAGVPELAATFDTMASTRVELALRLDRVADDDLGYLALLPGLMSGVGVLDHGKPIAADEVRERLRKEVLSLQVYFAESARSDRHELVIAGAGNDPAETKAAIAWMQRVLTAPDWRPDNLARLRDLVEQTITAQRQTMQAPEEAWVGDPREAWWRQRDAVHLHTSSFLTTLHDMHRLRWMLADAKAKPVAVKWLQALAGASKLSRKELLVLTAALAAGNAKSFKPDKAIADLAVMAGKDLGALLSDVPDDSLRQDWSYLCKQMARDLDAGAPAALAALERVRKRIAVRDGARLVVVGSAAHQQAIAGDVAALAGLLERQAVPVEHRASAALLVDRVHGRDATAKDLSFVGLYDPATSSGVFEDTAPAPGYFANSDADVLDYLTSNLYSGHGAHSMFMKTWAAGLAYSNGLHPQPWADRLEYYAERCPLLPQTLRFVIDQLRDLEPDVNIARYAVASAFNSRVAQGYEQRASEMAANLADKLAPDTVRAFRAKVLALAQRDDLAAQLFRRIPDVYGKVLPGFGPVQPGSVSFVIGPDKQLAAYQDYLHTAVAKDARLVRLYPRDFWIPGK